MRRRTLTQRDHDALTSAIANRRRQLAERGDGAPPVRIRKGPKKHGVNRERAQAARAKAKRARAIEAEHQRAVHEQKARTRAYWRGERDDCP